MSERDAARPPLLRFGSFELDSATGELRQDGAPVKLQQQPAKVLALLLQRAGELVTREEIRGFVWGQDTYVNFDQGLNFCIKEIRAALGDSADLPRFVETLPRRGYRFIAPVEVVARTPVTPGAPEDAPTPPPPRRATNALLLLVFALLALALLLTGVLLFWPAPKPRASTQSARVRIAVLPFENLSADPDQDYLSEGLAEELIAQLGRLSPERLAVIARASAQRYKGQPEAVERIGRDLGVDYAVLGSVRRSGERIRITVNLVKLSDRTQQFSETYDREARDLLTLQREIAQELARKIEVVFTPEAAARLQRLEARDPEAYQLYLRGRYFWNKRDEAGLRRATSYFEQAIARQPGYALAYVGLADAYLVLADHGYMSPEQALPLARAAAERSLQLDDGLAEAHATRAMLRCAFEWQWEASLAGFERALLLNPNYVTAHHWYSHCLRAMGRSREAVLETQRALELDPLSLVINNNFATALFYSARYAEAEAQYRRTLELDPDWAPAYWGLGRSLLKRGRAAEALLALERAAEKGPGQSEYLATLAHGYAVAGRPESARQQLRELQRRARTRYVSSYDLALALAAVGEREQAFRCLEQAYAERQSGLRLLKVDDRLESLRSDPRYEDLLRRLGLAAATSTGRDAAPRAQARARARRPARTPLADTFGRRHLSWARGVWLLGAEAASAIVSRI
jgi:TolB-like protein/DNA-binding winged helix-turn-helix (wHTH) protein/Flp pilus assembly protein TadD